MGLDGNGGRYYCYYLPPFFSPKLGISIGIPLVTLHMHCYNTLIIVPLSKYSPFSIDPSPWLG